MQEEISIVWFRQDLRLSDNDAILLASEQGKILPIYIYDDCAPDLFKIGSATKIWLYHSLHKLNESLDGNLNIYFGTADNIIESLSNQFIVKNIFWNAPYEPWHIDQDHDIKNICTKLLINYEIFNSNYLFAPNNVLKDDGTYYKVFTPYKKKCLLSNFRKSISAPKNLVCIKDHSNKTNLQDLDLIPSNEWYKQIENSWDIGQVAAHKKLHSFIENNLSDYKEGRNFPSRNNVSKLSPHLHFGEISPSQIVDAANDIGPLYAKEHDIEHFISEIIWREFSCYLQYHFSTLHENNFNSKFDNFAWSDNPVFLKAWQHGQTGYPLVDAGMRELWQTGYIHNRVRMVVASFLVKNLNIHWHKGRDWFWECLVDADLSNNSASWQWVAGSGADAAPYFRIFNPMTQGEKFDSNGEYTKKFVPELANMPDKYLFKPWEAPANVLLQAGVILGKTYPKPIIDCSYSRDQALARYARL